MRISKTFAFCLAAAAMAGTAAVAQVTRTTLQQTDVQGTGTPQEIILGTAVIPPGGAAGKHIHHGVEVGVVLEGEIDLIVDGEGTKHLKVGDSYKIDNSKPHDAKNTGTGPAKLAATWIVDKGKPLGEPVK